MGMGIPECGWGPGLSIRKPSRPRKRREWWVKNYELLIDTRELDADACRSGVPDGPRVSQRCVEKCARLRLHRYYCASLGAIFCWLEVSYLKENFGQKIYVYFNV